MNRGLRPVLDSIEFDGCPFCGEHPVVIQVKGADDIRLNCGHVVDAKAWADAQWESKETESSWVYGCEIPCGFL